MTKSIQKRIIAQEEMISKLADFFKREFASIDVEAIRTCHDNDNLTIEIVATVLPI